MMSRGEYEGFYGNRTLPDWNVKATKLALLKSVYLIEHYQIGM